MQTLTNILLIIGGGLLCWFTYKTIKRHPAAFSTENVSRSIFTLGILALILIGVISLLVLLLRQ